MLDMIKSLFSSEPKADFTSLVKDGAIILDVRSKAEFASGHIKGALNIPVGELNQNLKRLPNKKQPIITVCASGMRSGSATSILKSLGYESVYNAGSWRSLSQKLS